VGPDARLIPWFNIIFLVGVVLFLLFLWRVWQQFRERTVEPIFDDVGDRAAATRGRLRRWFGGR
jgi:hypothetical protein